MEYAAKQFIDGISFVASLGYMQYAADDHVDDMSYIICIFGMHRIRTSGNESSLTSRHAIRRRSVIRRHDFLQTLAGKPTRHNFITFFHDFPLIRLIACILCI